jgi:heterodisulfide reductase subunit A
VEKKVLVIGAGIAGIQSALDLADMGIKVTLIENTPTIGGHMAKLDKTFPTMDCSACILTPRMVDVGRHENIQILVNSEVVNICGKKGDFKVKIKVNARYVDEKKCTGCGTCAQKCPIEVPNEFDKDLGIRRAIYIPCPQTVPLIYTIDRDHCVECKLCERVCDAEAINFDQNSVEIEETFSSIIIATGFGEFDIRKYPRLGYGRFKNVYTALELERILNASGPTGGHILRLSDGKIPKRVAFIQCVGSRDHRIGKPYCSRVCCMYAIKNATLLKEHLSDIEVSVFYMDIRAFGKGFEEFYNSSAKRFKVKYIKGRVSEVREVENNDLIVRFENILEEKCIEEKFDMVILCPALVPSKQFLKIAEMIKLPLDEHGFVKIRGQAEQCSTLIDGIFVAGVAESPKDIPDTVAQASSAAMNAYLVLKEVET